MQNAIKLSVTSGLKPTVLIVFLDKVSTGLMPSIREVSKSKIKSTGAIFFSGGKLLIFLIFFLF